MKTYYCNNSMKFNLESMYTLVENLVDDFETGERKEPIYICGKKYDADNIDELLEEIDTLYSKAMFGKVTGKEYGRIKEIQAERQMIRYTTCLRAGMSEQDAGLAFAD